MAWTTMHFAAGMGCAGVLMGTGCLIFRRGWRWLGAGMTLGGVWALVPDMPRIFREDFPNAPFAALLGNKTMDRWLHSIGDVFFFHKSLDAQPHEYALAGFALVLIFYNLLLAKLLVMEHRQRHSVGNRAWRAHEPYLRKRRRPRNRSSSGKPSHHDHDDQRDPAIVGRIRSSHLSRTG